MNVTVIISGLIHTAILVWAIVGLTSPKAYIVKPVESIPVEILTPSEFTKIKAGTNTAKSKKAASAKTKVLPAPVKKAKPKKKKRIVKAVRPPSPKKKADKPEPKPKKKAKAKAKPKPKPKIAKKKKARPKPKKTAKAKKPVKKPGKKSLAKKTKKRNFSSDKIAALLNKIPDAGAPERPIAPPAPRLEKRAWGQSDGRDATMSISDIDAFRAQISRCWSPPVGGLGAERLIVKLHFGLNKDGTLSRQPRVVNHLSSPFFLAAADSAVRAVVQCQPYQLPEKTYAVWSDMVLNFDPRDMYGG